jgi:uncharacterized protein (TIRG00374 family)
VSRTSLRRALYWALSIAISVVLLYFALRGVDWGRVWTIIVHADLLYLGAATAITTWSFFVRSVRWRILLNAEGRFSVLTVFWANMAGYFGNSFLPARAGEVLRSVLISGQSSLSKTYVLTTALSERMMDVIALVLTSSIVLMGVTPKPRWMLDASRVMAAVAVAGVLFVAIVPHTGRLIESVVRRIPMPARLRPVLSGLTEQILLGLRAFHDWGRLAGFTALTVVIWASDGLGVIVSSQALGLHVTFPVAMLLLTALGLGSALPSTPGYVGVYQFAAVTTLTPFGVSRDGALAFILVVQVMSYLSVTIWGLPGMYFLRKKRSVT